MRGDYSKNSEILYQISIYAIKNYETIINQISSLNIKYPNNELLITTLSSIYIKIQESYIEILQELEGLSSKITHKNESEEAKDLRLQGEIIDTAFTEMGNRTQGSIKNALYLWNIAYYLYPNNEIIVQALFNCNKEFHELIHN